MKSMFKKIEIFEDKIILHPQMVFMYIGVVFTVLSLMLLSPIIFDEIAQGRFSPLFYFPLIVILLLIFYIGSRKIIFDNNSKAIYVKHFFRKRLLMPFSEVLSVKAIGGSTFYYGIQRKSDPYGAKVRLTMGKEYIRFKEDALPRINSFLDIPTEESEAVLQPSVLLATESSELPRIDDYHFFKKDGDIYRHKAGEAMKVWVKIALLAAGVFCFVLDLVLHVKIWDANIFGYLGIPLTILGGCFLFTGEDYFDTDKKAYIQNPTIGKQKVYPFSDFKTFSVVRESTYGIHTGQDVDIVFKDAKGEDVNILLCKGIKKSDIDRLIDETLSIMRK